MNNGWIIEALVDLWPEMPDLFRPAWRDVFPRIEEILVELRSSSTRGERNRLLRHLADQLGPFPAVLDRLAQARERRRIQRSEIPELRPPSWDELVQGIDSCLMPSRVHRQVEIRAPRRLSTSRSDVFSVTIAASPSKDLQGALRARELLEIQLWATPGAVELLEPTSQRMFLEPGIESAPLQFCARGLRPGPCQFLFYFLKSGEFRQRITLDLEIQAGEDGDPGPLVVRDELVSGGPYQMPADLDLWIERWPGGGRARLTYRLSSFNGALDINTESLVGPRLETPGDVYQKHLLARMEGMRSREELAKIGRELYSELFAGVLADWYLKFRGVARTLQIVSEEPWIPWELLKPHGVDSSGAQFDDPFLGEQFLCARWRRGPGFTKAIHVSHLACIEVTSAPGEGQLSYPARDHDFLARLARLAGLEDHSPGEANLEEVQNLFVRRDIDLLHVAAPGEIQLKRPAEARILLEDGSSFSDRDLLPGSSEVGRRPLVFLNVPYAAQQGRGLTRLEGWVQALVASGRCGILIAPLWRVSDSLAHLFSATFYHALFAGAAVGEAFAKARDQVRKEAPDDPAWISYCLYSNPHTKVTFVNPASAPKAT